MKRIGYDAGTRIYTFSDRDGKLYQGPPGEDYGVLKPMQRTVTIARPGAFASGRCFLSLLSMS